MTEASLFPFPMDLCVVKFVIESKPTAPLTEEGLRGCVRRTAEGQQLQESTFNFFWSINNQRSTIECSIIGGAPLPRSRLVPSVLVCCRILTFRCKFVLVRVCFTVFSKQSTIHDQLSNAEETIEKSLNKLVVFHTFQATILNDSVLN